MPILSSLTPCGQLKCSGDPSHAQKAYDSLAVAYGPGFDTTTVGGHIEASIYARARAIGRVRGAIERAANQRNPLKADDMLTALERDYVAPPGANDTLPMRRARVAAKRLLPNGALPWNVSAQLRAILGSDFIGYYPAGSPHTEAPLWIPDTTVVPPAPYGGPFVNAKPQGQAAKWLKLLEPVVQLGVPWTVSYGQLDPSVPLTPLLAGDVVMVQPENSANGENVTVTSAGYSHSSVGTPTFTATFSSAHDVGSTVTTMDWPVQWSAARTSLIVVLTGSVFDREKRRKVHEAMANVERAVGQWAIVYGYLSSPNHYTVPVTQPTFTLDATPLQGGTFVVTY